MNRHTSISPSAPLAPCQSPGGISTSLGGEAVEQFQLTTDDCRDCEGRGLFDGGEYHPDDPRWGVSWECDNCEGTGEVEALCCVCDTAKPLDSEGYCSDCADVSILSPEYLGDGRIAL